VFWASILDAPRPNPGLDTAYPAVDLMDVKSSFLSSYTQRTPVSYVVYVINQEAVYLPDPPA